jgi:hypothetical protein
MQRAAIKAQFQARKVLLHKEAAEVEVDSQNRLTGRSVLSTQAVWNGTRSAVLSRYCLWLMPAQHDVHSNTASKVPLVPMPLLLNS